MNNEKKVLHHVGKVVLNSEMLAYLEQLQADDAEIDIKQSYLARVIDILILYEGPKRAEINIESLLIVLALMKQDFEKLRKPDID